MQSVLSIQSFGRKSEYRRAVFTILSFYAFASNRSTRVLLFTDEPEWFDDYLKDIPVDYVLLTPAKIKEMRGEIDFLHRMKIALIEETFQRFPGYVQFYADSDTFFAADPIPLIHTVTPEKSSMHLCEYSFSSVKDMPLPAGRTFRDFYQMVISRKFYHADGTVLNVTPEMLSWNAGVMIFHPDHQRFIPDVYALTDQFYPDSQNHASEQYAFSILLQQHTEIFPCDTVNYHYWYRIKKQIADQFLEARLNEDFKKELLQDKLLKVKHWTAILPGIFEQHEWTLRDHAVQLFNRNEYASGYKWTLKALIKKPFGSSGFIKDVLYHIKRQLSIEK